MKYVVFIFILILSLVFPTLNIHAVPVMPEDKKPGEFPAPPRTSETISLSYWEDRKLGVKFLCNPDWELESNDGVIFIIIKENSEMTMSMTITKSDSPVNSLEHFTNPIIKEIGQYKDEFSSQMVLVDGKDAIKIQGFPIDHPETRLDDYYILNGVDLYSILFSISPKEKWEEYGSLVTLIIDSFKFTE